MNALKGSFGIVCLVFLISFVVGVESTIDCPEKMHFEEEAICTIDVSDVTDVYDVKIYVVGDTGGVNQIFDGESFRRADWYVNGLVEKEGTYEIKIKIHKAFDGKANVQFKLRDSSGKIVLYQEFDMRISSESFSSNQEEETSVQEEEEEENIVTEQEESQVQVNANEKEQEEFQEIAANDAIENNEDRGTKNVSKTIINLGGYEATEETIVYKSKTQRIKDYFVYFFVLFLLVIVCFLLFERYGNRNRDY